MKQVILIREDVEMSVGKTVAQGSHVSVKAVREAEEDVVEGWLAAGGKKITLGVESEQELLSIVESVEDLPTALVRDMGHTELESGTLTAGAIGPASESDVDKHTGDMKLYS